MVEHEIIHDHTTKRSRGFGFVVFDNDQVVDKVLANGNMIDMAGARVSSVEWFSVTSDLCRTTEYDTALHFYLNLEINSKSYFFHLFSMISYQSSMCISFELSLSVKFIARILCFSILVVKIISSSKSLD